MTVAYEFDATRWTSDPLLSYDFVPVEGLSTDKGYLPLIFVYPNSVVSLTPVDDPLYSAHQEVFDTSLQVPSYLPNYFISTLGCTEEWEFCVRTASDMKCTPSVGSRSDFEPLRRYPPSANDVQEATFDVLAPLMFMANLRDAALLPQPVVNITSRFSAHDDVQNVPADQWVVDFQALESWVWALARLALLDHFTGFPGLTDTSTILPNSRGARQVCRNQKVIVAGNFANINVFGLAFTLAVAGTLMLLDFVGLRLYTTCGQLKKSPAIQAWIDDGVYGLQRRAYKVYTKVPWNRTNKEVPVTSKGQMLHSLTKCAAISRTIQPSPTQGGVQGSKLPTPSSSAQSIGAAQSAKPVPASTTATPSAVQSNSAVQPSTAQTSSPNVGSQPEPGNTAQTLSNLQTTSSASRSGAVQVTSQGSDDTGSSDNAAEPHSTTQVPGINSAAQPAPALASSASASPQSANQGRT